MELEEGEYFAKPMNCPFHILIYKSKTRSYRELPVRLNELGTVYRYERSGTVHGILRARGLTMDDAHIFCRPNQVVDEIIGVAAFLRDLYRTVGLSPDAVRFSTKPEKAVGAPEMWELAEDAIREGLAKAGLDYTTSEGEGAFYGPKIDVDVRDAIGRFWQVCTIQVDFQEPDRFELEYIDEHGERQRPVMVHRALFGSVERFFGVLVEHFAGAFPTWLAPVQVVIIPIADRHEAYAHEVAGRLQTINARVEVDESADTMGAKIRRAQMQKVPYMLVLGDNEVESGGVSVRRRTGEESRGVSVDDLVERLSAEIETRTLDLTL
jgi:threonyl-tRNA synthetase